jgi:Flp pilus assembly protein TadB
MMDFGPVGIFVLVVTSAASFLLARWLSKRRRDSKRERERRAREASDSRQVRRARERRRAGR